nr:PEP/pyruvate-binding domain-containing protein [Tessaracoccus bendigoensis]
MCSNTALFGGKGANLIRLREAGFPVPPFAVLGTSDYAEFVAEHHLESEIAAALKEGAEPASLRIRAAFRQPISEEQRARLIAAVGPLVEGPVAVRSSATAEDLVDASFAGQQDTFLDVCGVDAVLGAIVECWSSLWTARAITYRQSHSVDPGTVRLAVVVQEMVPAEASGVLFTVDPLSGRRDTTVIDAVLGLGEQLVSGQVIPDHFEVDGRGVVTKWQVQGERAALTRPQALELAALGRRVEAAMGAPQDIEWTRVGDVLQVVQARPVTSLFPLPDGPSTAIWFNFGAFQGMLEPLTPLGQDALRSIVSGAGTLFGGSGDFRRNAYVKPAAERLWIRLDGVLRTRVGRRLAPTLLKAGDPNAAAALAELGGEGETPPRSRGKASFLRRVGGFARRATPNLVLAARRPQALRRRIDEAGEVLLASLDHDLLRAANLPDREGRLRGRVAALEAFARAALPTLLPLFAPVMAFGALGTLRVRALARRSGLADPDQVALGAFRALPGNVTTEMDLALWKVAAVVKSDLESARAFAAETPAALADLCREGRLPTAAQRALDAFLSRYGMRGVGEIDLGVPRWRDRPEGLLKSVVGYLELPAEAGPDVVYERSRRSAEADLDRLALAVGPLHAWQVRFLGGRVRQLFGARETPKFVLVRGLGLCREALLASGVDLAGQGIIQAAEEIFLLHLDELRGAFEGPPRVDEVRQRAAVREREQRRVRLPIMVMGDGRARYEGHAGTDLVGMGVSPGVVEGIARVVDHPDNSGLLPGEILVCRGTDPAWTPLFLTAVGLITEVGGLMTHGSVVAREYGLPAVVGVVGATGRIATGRRIRLDGSTGSVELL